MRAVHVVQLALTVFLGLAVVPVLHRAVVAGNAAVDLGRFSAFGAGEMLAREVAVIFADRIRRREGVVGELVVFGNFPHKVGGGFPVRQFFTEERMEHGAGGIKRLQIVLLIERLENIGGVADRQIGGIRVIRRFAVFGRRDDVGIPLHVVLGKTVGGGFRGRCLKVVEIAVLLLIVGETFAHVVQHVFRELVRFRVRQVFPNPLRVQAGFVHADQADGGEMVVKVAEVALRVGVKPFFQQAGDDFALDLERTRGDIHHPVETGIKIFFIFRKIGDARHVDRHDADGTGAFAAAEETAGFFAQLAQVKAQAAAHAAHVARLHVAVDVVGEVRRAVFRCHFKQQFVVFGVGPVEILRDGIGRNRVLEAAPVGVALDHGFDEGLVDHVHFFFAVFVFEIHLLAAHDGRQFRKVVRHRPVQRDVGERGLRAPAARRVHAVDERLDAVFDFVSRRDCRL